MRATASEAALSIFVNCFCSQARLNARPGFSSASFSFAALSEPASFAALSEPRSASNAQHVGSTSASPSTPYTRGLPQFHPPPGHIRSYSSTAASSLRVEAFFGNCWAGASRKAIRANAVGSTQLAVLGVHPHPRYVVFCETIRDFGRRLSKNRLSVLLSRRKSSHSHFRPAVNACAARDADARTAQVNGVTKEPTVMYA